MLVPLFLSTALIGSVTGDNTIRISTPDELVTFSSNTNSGTNYLGTTVFLDADIDLTGKEFEPIGKNLRNKYFSGTFDGQGHTISNLVVNSSSLEYIGLFGYLEEPIIRNIVLDASCSFESSFSGKKDISIGGAIGRLHSRDKRSTVENIVNLASVIFNGDTGFDASIGGIAGDFISYYSNSKVLMRNCANYGPVTHSGQGREVYIGGIAGTSDGTSEDPACIQNSLNFGAVTHNGKATENLYIGGIAGHSDYTVYENCVNIGSIVTNQQSNYTGSITGYVNYPSAISNCYWSEDSAYDAYGYSYSTISVSNTAKFNSNFVLNKAVSVGSYQGTSLIEVLNECSKYYILRSYSNWILNKNGDDVTFTMNGGKSFTVNSKVILLPDPITEEKVLSYYWYTDSSCTARFNQNEVSGATKLYGKFNENTNSYTISFDTDGGAEIKPITAQFGTFVSLPDGPVRDDCKIVFWETLYGDRVSWNFTVPAHDITLYPVRDCSHIMTVREFIDFSRLVNLGKTSTLYYSIYLDSDIEFTEELSQQFEQIGEGGSIYFDGTFDGQGHVISNLNIRSSSAYAGLFGSGKGSIIRNVVLDSSCSVTSSSSLRDNVYVGGIVGYYVGDIFDGFTIENCVNLASVAFNGAVKSSVYIGGIAGYLDSQADLSYVRNCANYGSISHTGSSSYTYIGGIAGMVFCQAYRPKYTYTYNCLNDGSITFDGKSVSTPYIGGIVGSANYNFINNSVSSGAIASASTCYIGSIAGNIDKPQNIGHCFWTNDKYNATSSDTVPDPETSYSEPSSDLVGKLNTYSKANSWNGWLLNVNRASVSFKINKGKGYTVKSQVVLIHDLVKNGRTFSGWYKDAALTEPFTGSEVDAETTLHGMWVFTIKFDFMNGTEINKTVGCGDPIPYPENMERKGYTFVGWFANWIDKTPYSKVNAVENVVLYAKYKEKISGGSDSEGGGEGGYEFDSKSGSSMIKVSPLLVLVLVLVIFIMF